MFLKKSKPICISTTSNTCKCYFNYFYSLLKQTIFTFHQTLFILKLLFWIESQNVEFPRNAHGNLVRAYHGNVVRYKVDIFKYKHTASKRPKLTASFEEAACLPTGLFFFKHPALSVPCMALLVQLWWMGERGESLLAARETGLALAGVGEGEKALKKRTP